jgi:hypothetical protein
MPPSWSRRIGFCRPSLIEVGDDADTARIRRPDREQYAVDAAAFDELRTKIFVEVAFSVQGLKRTRVEHAAEGIRIVNCSNAMRRLNA